MRIALALFLIVLPLIAQNDGIDDDWSPYAPSKQKFKKHDLVHVTVRDRTRAATKAEGRADKRERWQDEFNKFINFNKGRPRTANLTDDPGVDMDLRWREDDTASTKREAELTLTVTARVAEVLPNGQVVLEATKSQKINGETETIKLSGIADPQDIIDRKLNSENMADVEISYEGDGPVSKIEEPSMLGKFFRWVWPF